MTHTPIPWDVLKDGPEFFVVCNALVDIAGLGIEAEARVNIASLQDCFGDCAANAEFIIRACNAHDELLEACRAVLADIDKGRVIGHGKPSVEAMVAAIHKAEGTTP